MLVCKGSETTEILSLLESYTLFRQSSPRFQQRPLGTTARTRQNIAYVHRGYRSFLTVKEFFKSRLSSFGAFSCQTNNQIFPPYYYISLGKIT